MAAAAPYMFNVWVPGYHCETVLRWVEQKSIWGLTDHAASPVLLADGGFPLMLYEYFDHVRQHRLWQQPQDIHMDLMWQWEHHYCHQRLGSRRDGNVCFKISWSFMCQCQVVGWVPDPLRRSHMGSGGTQRCGMGAETNMWEKCSPGNVSPFLPLNTVRNANPRGCQEHLLCI